MSLFLYARYTYVYVYCNNYYIFKNYSYMETKTFLLKHVCIISIQSYVYNSKDRIDPEYLNFAATSTIKITMTCVSYTRLERFVFAFIARSLSTRTSSTLVDPPLIIQQTAFCRVSCPVVVATIP